MSSDGHPTSEPERDKRAGDLRATPGAARASSVLLVPTLCVAVYLLSALGVSGKIQRTDILICSLVFMLTFPWRSRFEHSHAVGRRIGVVGFVLLGALSLWAHLTGSLNEFHLSTMITLAVAAPLLHWRLDALPEGARPRRPRGGRRAVMVGAGPLATTVAQALQAGVSQAHVMGCFDDRAPERLQGQVAPKVLGSLADLAPFVREHRIQEVYVTLPLSSQPRIAGLLESMQGTTASVYYVPDVPGIGIIQGRLHDINGVPVLGLFETPFTGINEVVKRASDIVLSLLILLITAPVLLAIAVGVKLSSAGPVIFKQRRNGLDGHEITIYKFRTMTVQDDGAVVVQARRNDPRITRFGAFLRRTSLDELPQFFNVLEGQMSIVGPRPHAVAHNELYREAIKAYMVRHKVRPGITGWAQVNGLRGETETVERMQARVEYDIAYLRNWSVWLDLRIIGRTIRLLFFDRNAY
jgi:putative colanic acid biosynthesis UDP-glucose lipid carrier transferase